MINPYKKIKLLEKKIKDLEGIPNTSIHPKYKTQIIEVKEIKGRQLYQFKSLLDMPHDRYTTAMRFRTEFSMSLDNDYLGEFINIQEKGFSSGKVYECIGALEQLKVRRDMLISIDTSYRLASCVYFWEDEELSNYDFEIGDEKITLFKEIGFESFFLSKPMNNFIPAINLSEQDLKACSMLEKELQKLHSKQLKEENGKNEKMTS